MNAIFIIVAHNTATQYIKLNFNLIKLYILKQLKTKTYYNLAPNIFTFVYYNILALLTN